MPDAYELGEELSAARPRDGDHILESIVADRLFGHVRAAEATIDRFTLLERIGRGGMSDVFAAHDPVLDRKVALKLLRSDAGACRRVAEERGWLLREARAAARLAHPNVVAIHEVGELDGDREGIWVAMEHIDGVTLRAWLRDGRSRAEILDVLGQAGLGLAAAHDSGLVHGDFKPENVLVCGEGANLRARVVDFGLSRAPSRHEARGLLMGSPAYMAPEQLLCRPVDARSDQFAFCVTLHEALAGHHPYGADRRGATAREVLARIVAGTRPAGERALPRWLRRIVVRGLAVDPAARHPSMHAVVRGLRTTPILRRRRRSAIAGAILVLGSSSLTIAGLEHAASTRCGHAEAELHGVWDPSLRAAAREVFARSPLADAREVWRRLEPRLDEYARSWVASREQTCRGRLGASPLPPELAARRDACLDRRRAELQGITELLSAADRTTVDAALTATRGLTPIGVCEDLESLRREASLGDPEEQATVEALRQQILRRVVQARSGRGGSLGPAAEALLARARELAAPSVVAEALALHGFVQELQGDYDDAATTLETAALEAVAARHDRLHAELAIQLVWLHGARRLDDGAAQAWVSRAEAAIRALGGEPVLSARLLAHRGTLASVERDVVTAERLLREAIAMLRPLEPQGDLLLASTTGNLGTVLLAQGRPVEAAALLEESLDRTRELLGPGHPDVAALLSNLGQAHVTTGAPALGVEQLREALALKEQRLGPDHVELLTTLTNLGNAVGELGELHEARALLRRGLAIGERAFGSESWQLESLLHNLALTSWQLGDHAAAVHEAARALALQRARYGDDHPRLASTYELLARGQLGLGDAAAASETIERALALADDSLPPGERGSVLLSAAWIERENGAPQAAVRTLAASARALLGDELDPGSARELAVLLDPASGAR